MSRNTIFGWDLTTSQVGSGMCYETSGTFTVILVMIFHTALTHAVEILVSAEYDAEIHVEPLDEIQFDNEEICLPVTIKLRRHRAEVPTKKTLGAACHDLKYLDHRTIPPEKIHI